MTNQYDKSVDELGLLNYQFASMSAEEAEEKRLELEKQQAEKLAAKQAALQQKKGL